MNTEELDEEDFGDLTTQKDIPKWVRDRVLERDNYRCRRCGTSEGLTLHHIQKRSDSRNHHPDNLVTVCWWTCHRLLEEHRIDVVRIKGDWYFTKTN